MLENTPDYAPDLEWMLQSGQVPQELLLEALVHEYFSRVFRFSYAVLDDQDSARKVTNRVFSRALVEIYRYRAQEGVETWLYRIAIDACFQAQKGLQARRSILSIFPFPNRWQNLGDTLPETELDSEIWLAIDQLPVKRRQIVLLHFVLGWSFDRIAELVGENAHETQTDLEQIRRNFHSGEVLSQTLHQKVQSPAPSEIDLLIKNSLEKRWQIPEFTQTELDQIQVRINRQVRLLNSRNRGMVSVIEIGLILLIILVGTGIAWGMNIFGEAEMTPTPTVPRQSTVLVTKVVYQYITATPEVIQNNPSISSTPSRIDSSLYTRVRSNESLESLADRLGVEAQEIQKLNRIPEREKLEPGQRILIPDRWNRTHTESPTPVPTVNPGPSLGEPYIAEMVVQRFAIQGPRYNTLWFDAQIIDYGPQNYVGPPRIYRSQLWESDEQSLALIGFPDQYPEEVFLRKGTKFLYARLGREALWFSEWRLIPDRSSSTVIALQRMGQSLFDTRELERDRTITVFGREEQAGVQSLVLDVFDIEGKRTDRIWYDDSRGLVLRRTVFSTEKPHQPVFEVRLLSVAYDVQLPPELFDTSLPWRGGYARDPSGEPADPMSWGRISFTSRSQLPLDPAPDDFNPASSQLTFQYPTSFPADSPVTSVQLFGDSYYLGSVFFGDPWQMMCQRSPDGEWLAFVSSTHHLGEAFNYLRWFNLSQPENSFKTFALYPGITDFAFSPDSSKLAYFARPRPGEKGTLGVVDLVTMMDDPLWTIGDVDSLIWDPEGKSLAMITRFTPDTYLENVTVLDLESRKIRYNAPIDYLSNSTGEWPMIDWGVEFPVEMGGMEACAKPPLP